MIKLIFFTPFITLKLEYKYRNDNILQGQDLVKSLLGEL